MGPTTRAPWSDSRPGGCFEMFATLSLALGLEWLSEDGEWCSTRLEPLKPSTSLWEHVEQFEWKLSFPHSLSPWSAGAACAPVQRQDGEPCNFFPCYTVVGLSCCLQWLQVQRKDWAGALQRLAETLGSKVSLSSGELSSRCDRGCGTSTSRRVLLPTRNASAAVQKQALEGMQSARV